MDHEATQDAPVDEAGDEDGGALRPDDMRTRAAAELRAARQFLRSSDWAKVDERADFHLRQALILAIFDLTDAVRGRPGGD